MTNQDNPFAFRADADESPVAAASVPGHADLSKFVPPQGLHTFARITLMICCLLSVASMVSSVMQVNLLSEVTTGVGPDFDQRADANDSRELIVTLTTLLMVLIAGIVSLKLLYRLRSNVDSFGATGLESTAGWSVGWFFVPLVNLWKPLGATRQTWQASTSPQNWQSVQVPGILGAWWLFWILMTVVGRISSRYPEIAGEGVDALITGTWLDFGHSALTLVAAICYMSMLKQMTETQVGTFHSVSQNEQSRSY